MLLLLLHVLLLAWMWPRQRRRPSSLFPPPLPRPPFPISSVRIPPPPPQPDSSPGERVQDRVDHPYRPPVLLHEPPPPVAGQLGAEELVVSAHHRRTLHATHQRILQNIMMIHDNLHGCCGLDLHSKKGQTCLRLLNNSLLILYMFSCTGKCSCPNAFLALKSFKRIY